jgi:hypothetical protein
VAAEDVVEAFEAEENLVGLALVLEFRRVEGLDEVDIEVALRLGRRAVVGRAKEQVAVALGVPVLPFDLVLPDLLARDVLIVLCPLH